MRSLSDTIGRIQRLQARPFDLGARGGPGERLHPLTGFGSNPGALEAFVHVPEQLSPGAALVVALHGCTQGAHAYDHGSGWSQLAERHNFAVLLPQQRRANNANLCFNWFEASDSRRGAGEAMSIRQMIAALVNAHGIDPAKVFITGLSAGGAMTSVMLATYPEVFAGGAIIAGLPYGTASTVPEAFDRMRGHGLPKSAALSASVRDAAPAPDRWPTISAWHGTADNTVSDRNAEAILKQWRGLYDLPATPSETQTIGTTTHRRWKNPAGRVMLEDYRIPGLGHGTPLSTSDGEASGTAGPYMLEAGISSTDLMAEAWGLLGSDTLRRSPAKRSPGKKPPKVAQAENDDTGTGGIRKVIEDALKAAGLM